eukprot:scaffold105776_cov32-Tisochrysis_lutea.AAC.3
MWCSSSLFPPSFHAKGRDFRLRPGSVEHYMPGSAPGCASFAEHLPATALRHVLCSSSTRSRACAGSSVLGRGHLGRPTRCESSTQPRVPLRCGGVLG